MKPFADIRVLDLTQSIAGPYCTQMLGNMGADIVKVEPPAGDAFRELLEGSMYTSVNTGYKRSLCVDLKSESGLEAVHRLSESADVIIESFRPGVVEKFDLDYDSVTQVNPDVIYVSLSGYGQDGDYSEWPGYDPIVQAVSGLMSMIGYPDRPPVRIGASIIDCGTGTNAAFLIASALLQREKAGEGEYFDVSLFDVAISWLHYWVTYYSTTGDVPERAGQGFSGFAPSRVFHASGEKPFYMSIVNDSFFERLCRAIDRLDLLEDDRYATNDSRLEYRETLESELDETFRTFDHDTLIDTLTSAGVPAGPVQSIDEVVDADPHVMHREILTEVYNTYAGKDVKVPQLPFETLSGRQSLEGTPPTFGEHTREILVEIGFSTERIEAMLDSNAVSE